MHRLPNKTVKLGNAIELVTIDGDNVTRWNEVKGWNMLTTPEAFEHGPGRARLFLVPGELDNPRPPRDAEKGTQAYDRWHKRTSDVVGYLDGPDGASELVGRATRLDYASDKWRNRGQPVEYTHAFDEDQAFPPLVYVDNPSDPSLFILTGGDMRVTEAGID